MPRLKEGGHTTDRQIELPPSLLLTGYRSERFGRAGSEIRIIEGFTGGYFKKVWRFCAAEFGFTIATVIPLAGIDRVGRTVAAVSTEEQGFRLVGRQWGPPTMRWVST